MQITMMIITAVFSFAMPIGLLVFWKRRSGLSVVPFLTGALCFLLFSMGLEQMLHAVCIAGDNAFSRAIQANPWLYVAYGCLAAGIFEEGGRLFAYRFLLRNYSEKEVSVAYGIGHGGIETIMTLGLTYVLLTLVRLGVNVGEPEAQTMLLESANATTVGEMGLAILERISAMMLHIGLSILVFRAAFRNEKTWFPAAIILHALANVTVGMYQVGLMTNILAVEIIAFLCAVCVLGLGISLYRKE